MSRSVSYQDDSDDNYLYNTLLGLCTVLLFSSLLLTTDVTLLRELQTRLFYSNLSMTITPVTNPISPSLQYHFHSELEGAIGTDP
jgi:hypothetical protein